MPLNNAPCLHNQNKKTFAYNVSNPSTLVDTESLIQTKKMLRQKKKNACKVKILLRFAICKES